MTLGRILELDLLARPWFVLITPVLELYPRMWAFTSLQDDS